MQDHENRYLLAVIKILFLRLSSMMYKVYLHCYLKWLGSAFFAVLRLSRGLSHFHGPAYFQLPHHLHAFLSFLGWVFATCGILPLPVLSTTGGFIVHDVWPCFLHLLGLSLFIIYNQHLTDCNYWVHLPMQQALLCRYQSDNKFVLIWS